MGCSQSKSQPITTLPKGATPEKAPTDYRRKNQYHIPVVLPPSRDNSAPIQKTNDETIEAIIRSQNESNGNAVNTNEDIKVNGTESVVVSSVEIVIEEVKDHEEKAVVIETTEKTTRSGLVEQDDFKWNDIVDAPVDTETVENPVESSQEEVIVEVARKSVESVIEEAEDKLNQEPEEMAEPIMIKAYVEPTKEEAIAEFITSESIDEDEGKKTVESAQIEETLQSNEEELQRNEETAPQDTTGANEAGVSEELQVGTTASVEDVIENKTEPTIEEPIIEEATIQEPFSTTEKNIEESIAVPQETQESNEIEVDRVEPVKEDTEIDAKQIEEPSPDYTTQGPIIEENKVPESNEGTVADVEPMETTTKELKEETPHDELTKNEETTNKELVEDSVSNEEIVEKQDDQIPESNKEDNQQTVEPNQPNHGEANHVNPEETNEVVTKQDEKIPEVDTMDKLEESRKSTATTEAPLIATDEPDQKNTDDVSQESVMSKPESTTNVTESFKETESKLQAENNENTIGV